MLSFMRQSVSRERPAWVDDGRGNVEPDFSGVSPVSISGCSVQPGASVEDMQNREGARISWTVFAPASADVQHLDRVSVGGQYYRLVGEPERWPSPSGGIDHVKFLLERWVG